MPVVLLKLSGLILFFVGAAVFIYQLFPRESALKKSLGEQDVYLGESARFINTFRPAFQFFLPIIQRLPLGNYRRVINRSILFAGIEQEVSDDDFMAFQIVTMLIFGFLFYAIFKNAFFTAIGAVFGISFPFLWLYEKRRTRQNEIQISMPNVVDMLSLSVEAGLDFNASIKRICEIYKQEKDPFVGELYLMNQNIQLGMSRENALRSMADRVDILELHAFVSIMIQAEKMGANIVDVLKAQARRMRQERFMRAERSGAVASQKLMIPMILCIFPVIFIVILVPYIIKYVFT